MTKMRTPNSVEDAVTQACALLGKDVIAMVLTTPHRTVSEGLVAKWGDPDDPAHRISLIDAVLIEQLLIKTGNEPVFVELFAQLQPKTYTEEPAPDPLREAMRATKSAADLMEHVDSAMIDGRIDRGELAHLEQLTSAAQRQLSRLRRIMRAAQQHGGSKSKGK